jgi:hypothetical protein
VSCTATDSHGNVASGSFTVSVRFAFSGLTTPAGKTTANAGQTIPISFKLGGNMGLGVIASTNFATPGSSSLSYVDGVYSINWKTEKAWVGTTQTGTLTLIDGTSHSVTITFK